MTAPVVESLQHDLGDRGLAYLYHVGLGEKPLEALELARLRSFVGRMVTSLVEARALQASYFVQVAKIEKQPWRDLLSQNARFWKIRTGLGCRPGRPLPRVPTLKDIATLRRPVLPEMVYEILPDPDIRHFLLPGEEIPSVTDVYLGCGGCGVFLVADGDVFTREAKAVFGGKLDEMFDRFFECFVPLFGLKDFTSASRETVRLWFDLFEIYIGEVQDEPGLLIASRQPIAKPLADLQHFLDG